MEYKFRAWDSKNKKMIYPAIIGIEEDFCWENERKMLHNCMDWDGEEGFINKPILMLCSPLKDIDGDELYQDDIILDYSGHIGLICYGIVNYYISNMGGYDIMCWYIDYGDGFEEPLENNKVKKIGDKFNNPELVEGI